MGNADAGEPPIWHGLLAGATSGLIARVVTYPADTLKARQQVTGALNAPQPTLRQQHSTQPPAALHRSAGLRSLYAGFSAVLWGVVPANIAYFGGYEAGKRLVPPGWGMAGDMATGAVAQLLAGCVYTPIDTVKERLQVQPLMRGAYSYASARQAYALLASGGPMSLFKGYWVTNVVWLPWNTLYIAGYESAKRAARQMLRLAPQEELPAAAVATCSATAAAAAAVVTHPADVVKTRLQVLAAAPGGQSLTAAQVARRMLQQEGLGAAWHGLGARLLNIAPGCALSWALYEHIKAQMRVWMPYKS